MLSAGCVMVFLLWFTDRGELLKRLDLMGPQAEFANAPDSCRGGLRIKHPPLTCILLAGVCHFWCAFTIVYHQILVDNC